MISKEEDKTLSISNKSMKNSKFLPDQYSWIAHPVPKIPGQNNNVYLIWCCHQKSKTLLEVLESERWDISVNFIFFTSILYLLIFFNIP